MSYLPWSRFSAFVLATGAAAFGISQLPEAALSSAAPQAAASEVRQTDQDDASLALGLAIAAGGAGIVFYASKGASPSSRSRSSTQNSSHSVSLSRLSSRLRRKLLRLLHDDRKAAERLLVSAKLKHPDRSIQWCAEKVIYDLERDRGRV